jgi:hypothetical protein
MEPANSISIAAHEQAVLENEIGLSGDDGGGDTHVPIPNTTVKPSSADGTWSEGSRESRTLPGNRRKAKPKQRLRFFVIET